MTVSSENLRALAELYGIELSDNETDDSIRARFMTIFVPPLTEEEKAERLFKLSVFFHSPAANGGWQ